MTYFRCLPVTIIELRGRANVRSVARYRCRQRPAATAPLSAGRDRSAVERAAEARLRPTSSAICAAMAGITVARWPAPIRRGRRLNFRPLHIVMISTLIDDAEVGGATLEINLRARDGSSQSPRLAAMCRVRCNPDFPWI